MNRQPTEKLDGLGDYPGLRRMKSKRAGNLPPKEAAADEMAGRSSCSQIERTIEALGYRLASLKSLLFEKMWGGGSQAPCGRRQSLTGSCRPGLPCAGLVTSSHLDPF
jgi:hypothetical protein